MEPAAPQPGWIVVLDGKALDLIYWERALKPPFDPHFHQIQNDSSSVWGLRSSSFDELQTAEEVMARAIALVGMLNGALRTQNQTEPLIFGGVGRIDEKGKLHQTQFAKGQACVRSMITVTSEVINAIGNPFPPSPSVPSLTQKWTKAAQVNDDIADMLTFGGRADNWFDIYKAMEMAKIIAGTQKNLETMLGGSHNAVENMRRTANFYRHARSTSLPPVPTSLHDAMTLLPFVIRTVLNAVVP